MAGDPIVLSAFGTVGGLVAFARGFSKLRALRRIENTPTSSVRSMPMGGVELHGTAQAQHTLFGPFTGKPAAYWEVEIEEYKRSGKHSRWVTVHKHNSADYPFWLEDPTGSVLVLPAGSETHLSHDYQKTFSGGSLPAFLQQYVSDRGIRSRFLGFGKRLRFTEWHIEVSQTVYLHGVAQERPDLNERRRERINEVLRDVREDPEAMEELDVDGDGQVDSLEWERARDMALARVRAEGVPDRVVVAKGDAGELFLISDRSERDLVRRLRWETFGYVFGGGAAFVAGTAYLVHQFIL
jgi:hypothetical protein